MQLVPQSHKFENLPTREQVYAHIVLAGRTCYQSHGITEGNEAFIRMLIKRGHESVLEHISLTCRIVTDRGISHEIVRHRLCSFSQESTRYCRYDDDVTFIDPDPMGLEPENRGIVLAAYMDSEIRYIKLL